MRKTLDIASQWHAAGIACIPILARSKSPALESWKCYQSRLPRPAELESWFMHSVYGIAVITGWRGLVIVDFDDLWTYSTWLAGLPVSIAAIALSTLRVSTARGIHVYIYCDGAHNARLNGIDVKAKGGYCLTAPTIHPSGVQYAAIGNINDIQTVASIKDLLPNLPEPAPECVPIAAPMSEFDKAIGIHSGNGNGRTYALAALAHSCERVAIAANGSRNHDLNKNAYKLRPFVGILSQQEIEDALTEAVCKTGLSRMEARRTIRCALQVH